MFLIKFFRSYQGIIIVKKFFPTDDRTTTDTVVSNKSYTNPETTLT